MHQVSASNSVRASRRILVVVSLVMWMVCSASTSAAAGVNGDVDYRPPSDAAITDHFRPPPKPWMAGNRGIDYGTEAGAQILAAADGRVIFAGQVGGQLHVTVEHADGLRTSYSFLSSLSVVLGDRVRCGDVIGIAGGPFHFGVRTADGTYLDPERLLEGSLRPSVRLIPGTDQGLDRLDAQERRTLLDVFLDTGAAALSATSSWSARTTALLAHYAAELNPVTHGLRAADAFSRWLQDQLTCTDQSVAMPTHEQRRIVVLVSGLGTSSDANTAWEIDTAALGYAEEDVVRFSYRGGQAPRDRSAAPESSNSQVATRPFDMIATRPFTSIDSQQDIGSSSDRLSDLLQAVSIAQPGVPVDVVAHSQGGVVARLAIERSGADGRLPFEVDTLVTVSSPQQGAPLATGVVALGDSIGGSAALSRLRAAGAAEDLDERHPAISDLAETSAIIDEMHRRPMPDGVRFATIGGSGDLVVPGTVAGDPAADSNVILPTAVGTEAHGSLPSSSEATREIALAVAGRGHTCQGLGEASVAFLTAETIRSGETLASATAAVGLGVLAIPPAE